jgi:hypothetical protein
VGISLSKSYAVWSAAASVLVCFSPDVANAQALQTAIMVKHTFDVNGNNVIVDSFDSSNPLYSNYGRYDPSHPRDKGEIDCNDTIVNSVSANINIYGYVRTGPSGTATIGSAGGIGSHAWQAVNPGQIEPGWYSHNSSFISPDVTLPYAAGLPPEPGTNFVTAAYNISSNYVRGSSIYPNPPPWSGVATNCLNYVVNPTWPGPIVCVVTNMQPFSGTTVYPDPSTVVGSISTNYNTAHLANQLNRPADGTYVPGSLVQLSNGHWSYDLILSTTYSYTQIVGYTYPTALTYNYVAWVTNAVYSTNHYDHVLNSGDYYFTGSLSGTTVVQGNARLVLPNGLNMSGSDSITIANGGSLKLYCGGTSCVVGGNGIANLPGYAQDFILVCSWSVTALSFNGNGEFIGVIIAPNADVTMNGGGHAVNDFEGAILANSIRLNGMFGFHYDESLARISGVTAAATLSGAASFGSNQFHFMVDGVPGVSYAIEASTNLVDWLSLQTNAAPFQFMDSAVGDYDRRFYRAVLVK